jgi:hypothetical protein
MMTSVRRVSRPTFAVLAFVALLLPIGLLEQLWAQGVTTGNMSGVVTNAQAAPVEGATVLAIHEPSGTSYETLTRADGRFTISNMRVGGPYSVQVVYTGTGQTAFAPQTREGLMVNLGVTTDVDVTVQAITVAEEVTVSGQLDSVFASTRTGAATQVSRDEIYNLPTIGGRIESVTRMTPQASGSSFAGQDNRLNNITVDGSYFNNAFGLGSGQPGGRTDVAPISLESIEQVQVSIAPFDVRQGNFVGAAVNTVTRSGTNQLTGSVYHRTRNESFVGTEARGFPVNPGTFTFRNTGLWAGGPVVRNRVFLFGNYENEKDVRPINTYRANRGGEPATGSVTRVLASDLDTLSAYLRQNFQYETGGYENLDDETPAKRYLVRGDYNLNNSNKISVRYNQLESSSRSNLSSSGSAGLGRSTLSNNHLNFEASNYAQLEKIKSGVGEWNAVIGNSMSNNLIVGLTSNDENRGELGKIFPFVDVLGPDGTAYLSFGSEPFTPNNQLRYKTFQVQENFTKFGANHSLIFGATAQRYEAQNVFWNCCPHGNYVYYSLQDFYADANGYLANPNRTTSPVGLRYFKQRYSNYPGLDDPLQELKVWYGGAYAQDEWRPGRHLTVTMGVRFDVPAFENTAFANAKADALTFRDEHGSTVQYSTGSMPPKNILWSPRVGLNWSPWGSQRTQLRGGTGVFTGPPLYVWISNQLGNTGVLIGEIIEQQATLTAPPLTTRPFHPDPRRYWPANVTGEGAASYELNVTDPDFKFPQVWRTNFGVDHQLPGNIVGTAELIYNRDINGIYYINANLPAPQTTFNGVDNRPRWTANRINNTPGNQVTSALVMKNQSVGSSWNVSGSLSKTLFHGLSVKGAYSYGEAWNTIDPGSTASSTWSLNQHSGDPNSPGLGLAASSQGHRVFLQTSYTRSYFGFGATTISAFWEARPSLNQNSFSTTGSYVFAGDMNGDSASGNDLIYIPRDTSEMNFVTLTAPNGAVFTADQQVQAFEAYINQDKYLRSHRGQYAERGAVFYPMMKRIDLSLTQDIFRNVLGKRNAGQFRIDIANFGNLLNHNWGVSQRFVVPTTQANGAQLLTNPVVDAQGRSAYRLAVVNNQLVTSSFQPGNSVSPNTAGPDVYQFMLSFRYTFN